MSKKSNASENESLGVCVCVCVCVGGGGVLKLDLLKVIATGTKKYPSPFLPNNSWSLSLLNILFGGLLEENLLGGP